MAVAWTATRVATRGTRAPLSRSHPQPGDAPRLARQAGDRAHADGVPPARALPVPPRRGADADDDLPPRLGVRLRLLLQLADGLRRLPAPEDGRRRRAAAPADRARHRLR